MNKSDAYFFTSLSGTGKVANLHGVCIISIVFVILYCSCSLNKDDRRIDVCYPLYELSLSEKQTEVLRKISFIGLNDVSNNVEKWYTGDTLRKINGQLVREHVVCIFKKGKLHSISIMPISRLNTKE